MPSGSRPWWAVLFVCGATLAVVIGCAKSPPSATGPAPETPDGPAWFRDVTDEVGLDFTHDPGPDGSFLMPQAVGSGCAIFDCDGDGRLDIYLLQNAGPKSASRNRLFRQTKDGKFEDISAGSGLDIAGYCMGVAVGDVNNDGRPDVLVTAYGGSKLFLNLGGGKFEDVTAECGLDNLLWGTSAAFFDYDRDGLLDLVIVNYVDYDPSWPCSSPGGVRDFCAPKVFPGTVSKLFHNRGPGPAGDGKPARVRFEDVSVASGIGLLPGPGLGVVCADFDGDGWPDVFVANDGQPNRLWMNQKNGTFKEEAVSRNVALTQMGQAYAGMGVAAGDADNDGMIDLYVTHLTTETNTFWKQGPRGQFKDQTAALGLTGTRWRGTGFGTLMADFDNDGWLDIAIVNGRVQRGGAFTGTGLPPYWEPYAERNQVLANAGGGKFRDVSHNNPALCGTPNVGRGLACGDIDGDGGIDLLVLAIHGKARLLRNVAPDRGHWLAVRAIDPKLNRDAYGAEVTVKAGGTTRLRLVTTSDTYLSSNSPVAHFGLGSADKVDAVEVLWPDGTKETFPGGAADRAVELRKGEGRK
jgi:hypothetical protein